MDITCCPVNQLHQRLAAAEAFVPPATSAHKPLSQWRMDEDDAPILRYLFCTLSPRRHLEFGTWQGAGTLLCLESCNASVWTMNLLDGETTNQGQWSYYSDFDPQTVKAAAWANARTTRSGKLLCQTDARGFIGRLYLERGLGHRVCQIYCDSREWDTSHYPKDFFDTALVDGGHTPQIVVNDTKKALSVLRPGGAILWHDFCLDDQARQQCDSVAGVSRAVEQMQPWMGEHLYDWFWIQPSWILVGIKHREPVR